MVAFSETLCTCKRKQNDSSLKQLNCAAFKSITYKANKAFSSIFVAKYQTCSIVLQKNKHFVALLELISHISL